MNHAIEKAKRQNNVIALFFIDLDYFKEVNDTYGHKIGDDVYSYLTLEGSVNSRDHIGGTAPKQVKQAVERAKERLKNL